MPELVLSPSLDLAPWRGESLTNTIYESPMSPTVVKFRAAAKPAVSEAECTSKTTTPEAAPVAPAPQRSPEESAVGLTGLSLSKLRMLQSHFAKAQEYHE